MKHTYPMSSLINNVTSCISYNGCIKKNSVEHGIKRNLWVFMNEYPRKKKSHIQLHKIPKKRKKNIKWSENSTQKNEHNAKNN